MVVTKEVLLTPEGLEKLEKELLLLKTVKRKEVSARIKVAISFGDISENSEYEDAKNEQAFVEGRIIALEKMLQNTQVIDTDKVNTDVVHIGATVKLKDLEYEEEVEYTIVGPTEANPLQSKISYESPVGKEILGKPAGTTIEVNVPAGILKYEILGISK